MSEKDYSNMSLGEIIRDMKEKRVGGFAEDKPLSDNSPFLRRNGALPQPRFPLVFKSQYLKDRSNYLNHMARKKIKNAVKTDLRYKLNRLKATTEGLELRWKIVANEIDRTRNARRIAFEGQPSTTRMGTDTNIQAGGDLIYPRSRLSMINLERKIGMKLPEWIFGTAARSSPPPLILHQPVHHHHHHHQSGPSSVVSSCCQIGSNESIERPMLIYEAPPLSNYLADDMPPPFTSQPPPLAWCNPQDDDEMNKFAGTEEEVEYIVEDRLESDQCTKVTLHQRFSSLH